MAKAKEATAVVEKTKKYTIPHFDSEGKAQSVLSLPETSLESKVSETMISQVIRVMLSRVHQDTTYAKNRSEVRGGGKKPWRQKGTGRARQGSIRSPQWVGGGVVHGPVGNGRELLLPKKWAKPATFELLRKLVLTGNLIVADSLAIGQPKTKEIQSLLKNLNLDGRILIVVEKVDNNLLLSSRNLDLVRITSFASLNTLELIRADKVVLDTPAFDLLKKALEVKNDK